MILIFPIPIIQTFHLQTQKYPPIFTISKFTFRPLNSWIISLRFHCKHFQLWYIAFKISESNSILFNSWIISLNFHYKHFQLWHIAFKISESTSTLFNSWIISLSFHCKHFQRWYIALKYLNQLLINSIHE